MVEITQRRLGAAAETAVCDIRQLEMLSDSSVAIRHKSGDLQNILADIGFDELMCEIVFDEDMAMDAVYIEASKNP